VLAVLRVAYTAAAAGGDLNVNIVEINDKRVFLKTTPMYLTPVTSGVLGNTAEVATAAGLDALHGAEAGVFSASKLSAIWSSYGAEIASTTADDEDKDVLYYSATHAARFTRSVFDRVLTSTATSIDLTSTDANILVLTPSNNFAITTSGPFPAGYVIEIQNLHGSYTGTFALDNSSTDAIDDSAHATNGYARYVCITSHATNPVFVRIGVF